VNDESVTARPHPLVVLLVIIVGLQAAALAAATISLVVEIFVDVAASVTSAIALTVLTAIGAVLLALVARNLLRGAPWTRGATVVAQILQIALAVGAFQGAWARPDLGWLLLLPAVAALVLLFTRPVLAHTVRPDGA
jgi:hypothetical protein